MVTATNYPDALETLRGLARPLTASDLESLPDDGNRYELIGGQLFVSPSPNTAHQRISMKLGSALSAFLMVTTSGEAFAAPMDVHLSARDVVQPDLLVVLNERADIVQQHGIVGAPDLVIEIVSPSSTRMDYLRKSKLYEHYGVREYWIVDPIEEMVSIQRLEDGVYVLLDGFGRDDTLRSPLLEGFELDLALIFPERPAAGDVHGEESQSTDDNQ